MAEVIIKRGEIIIGLIKEMITSKEITKLEMSLLNIANVMNAKSLIIHLMIAGEITKVEVGIRMLIITGVIIMTDKEIIICIDMNIIIIMTIIGITIIIARIIVIQVTMGLEVVLVRDLH